MRMPTPLSLSLRCCLVLVSVVASGCSFGRVNERMVYWSTETQAYLPSGTSLADADRFFLARGLKLTCCVSGPAGAPKYYYAAEHNVGRMFITEYDVAILVSLNASQEVEGVRVERWGVGL
jgi:hypothetical protein